MTARHDEQVHGRPRVQVAEGDELVVAHHHLGRHLAGRDLAEDAVAAHQDRPFT